jgi:hypothetical protein
MPANNPLYSKLLPDVEPLDAPSKYSVKVPPWRVTAT